MKWSFLLLLLLMIFLYYTIIVIDFLIMILSIINSMWGSFYRFYRCMLYLFTVCDLIQQNTIALIGSSKSDTYALMESYSRALKLPFLVPTMTRESVGPRSHYIVSMCPSFIDAVIDIIQHFQWNKIFYLFDTDDGKTIWN